MYRALWSWLICVVVTVVVSLLTKPMPESKLAGLVYGCTELPSEGHLPLYQRPIFWAAVVAVVFVVLQHYFLVSEYVARTRQISIWFFIGVLLAIYGVIILGPALPTGAPPAASCWANST